MAGLHLVGLCYGEEITRHCDQRFGAVPPAPPAPSDDIADIDQADAEILFDDRGLPDEGLVLDQLNAPVEGSRIIVGIDPGTDDGPAHIHAGMGGPPEELCDLRVTGPVVMYLLGIADGQPAKY